MGKDKILFIAVIERHLISFHIPFMKDLQGKGYKVHVATKLGDRKEELEKKDIICHNIDFTRSVNLFAAFKSLVQLIRLMKRNSFSLVHVHTPMASFLGRLAAKLTHTKPVLYTAHGFHFYKGAPWYYWAFIYPAEYFAAKWTDGLIVMNQEDYMNAQKMGFKPNKNLFFVHGVGVDLKPVIDYSLSDSNIKKELGIDDKNVVISYVAMFIPRKNHLFLLEGWSRIIRKIKNVNLLLIGDGEYLEKIKKLVVQKSLSRVHFLGYRKDILKIILESDIIELVSKQEGLPRAIMEAMALGKPVIVSNIRGNRELVNQGKNGFLVDLGDVDGLVSSMKKLITNDKLRADMGRASLEKIKNYSLKKALVERSSIYDYYLK